jgi:hypothetical protein
MADDSGRASLTDAEIYRSVRTTVLDVLLPALPANAEWARVAAIQLAGLVTYAERRGPDRTSARLGEVVEALTALGSNRLVAGAWDGDRSQEAVMAAAGAVLASAVGNDDPDAVEVRSVLRALVVRQLDDELAETATLVDAFRGKLDG